MPDTPIQDLPIDPTVAWVFPGQGAQHVGMGADLADQSATARAIFSTADLALDMSLSQICWTEAQAAIPAFLVLIGILEHESVDGHGEVSRAGETALAHAHDEGAKGEQRPVSDG